MKWGLNPNSSSLGVDVTFLLFGASALAMLTPLVSALVRLRGAGASAGSAGSGEGPATASSEGHVSGDADE